MEISLRDLLTDFFGIGLGILFLLAFLGAIAELYRMSASDSDAPLTKQSRMMLHIYLCTMVILSWITVLFGAYFIFPWYNETFPIGAMDLGLHSKAYLEVSGATGTWHRSVVEWKEHISWIAPIAMTMVAYVFMAYGTALEKHRQIRIAAFVFVIAAFVATGVSVVFGGILSKVVPVEHAPSVQLFQHTENKNV